MGFSISAATALIFASLFLAFGIFYPAMANGYERVEEADAAKADQNLDQAQTDITFVNYEYDNNKPTINVSNTGETALTVDEVDVILQPDVGYVVWDNNGQSKPLKSTVIDDNGRDSATNLWLPGEYLELVYDPNGPPPDNPDRFKVVTEHGVSISGDT